MLVKITGISIGLNIALRSKSLLLFGSLFSSFLVLLSSCFLLSFELVVFDLLAFLFENGFNEYGSVFELVTL